MTDIERKMLWSAIQREQRPLAGSTGKTIFLFGLIFVAVGLGLRHVGAPYGLLVTLFGIFGIFCALLTMQKMYRLDDDAFRRKPLRTTTISKLRVSLGHGLLDDLMRLKEANSDKCLHVADILDLLECAEREVEEAKSREVAKLQHAALSGQ